ncbi:MAG TPA: hypothetical protein VGQ03_01785 [Nitrososphaera sp.]|jgi:hypothetical protein|nr:hypothetical protein [Nitrososphaera sp.]
MRHSINASVSFVLIFVFASGTIAVNGYATSDEGWLTSFNLEECELSSTGSNSYFFLEPGYQLTLEGQEDGDRIQLILTVLNETRIVDGVETRVVEERESENGELIEVSINFLSFCNDTKDIFYFGEEVDMYADGEVESHGGEWLAGEDGAAAGLLYPSNPTVGMKYYQEIAPGVAEDRAEVLSLDEVLNVPAGNFEKVLKVEETTPLESGEKEYKYYAPGIGLLQDEDLKLTKYVIPEQPATNAVLRSQPQSVKVAEDAIEVQVNSTSTISDFALDEENKKISFNVNGAAGADGMTEIYIGKILEGPYTVTVDGEVMDNVEVIQSEESATSIIKIAHSDDSQVIAVTGTNVVPEFPINAIWIASLTGVLILFARSKMVRKL